MKRGEEIEERGRDRVRNAGIVILFIIQTLVPRSQRLSFHLTSQPSTSLPSQPSPTTRPAIPLGTPVVSMLALPPSSQGMVKKEKRAKSERRGRGEGGKSVDY